MGEREKKKRKKVNDRDSTSIMRTKQIERRGYLTSILTVLQHDNEIVRGVRYDGVCDAV